MKLERDDREQQSPKLSDALIELRTKVLGIQHEVKTLLGLIDNIYRADNTYELLHMLKSLVGRDKSFTKLMRQFVALLEPIEIIAHSIGVTHGKKV